MTNPDLFRQIVFQVVRYDTEFLVLGIVDMKTSGQEFECISWKTVADSPENIGDSPVGTGTQYGICVSAINATTSSSLKISGTTPSGVWVKNRSK